MQTIGHVVYDVLRMRKEFHREIYPTNLATLAVALRHVCPRVKARGKQDSS